MEQLNLKDACIVGISSREGLFEITLSCRLADVSGEISENTGLDVDLRVNRGKRSDFMKYKEMGV